MFEDLASGNEEAWAAFNRNYTWKLRLLARDYGARSAAADMAQQVLLSLMNAIVIKRSYEYNPEKGKFRGYLARCVRNEVIRWWQKNRGRQPLPDNLAAEIDDYLETAEEKDCVHYTLRDLQSEATGRAARDLEIFRRLVLLEEPPLDLANEYGVSRARIFAIKHEVRAVFSERYRRDWGDE